MKIFKQLFNRPGREDLFVLGEQRLERLRKEGRYSCYRSTRAVLRKLSLYMKGKPLPLGAVTPELLDGFRRFLAIEMGNSHNTIVENIKLVQRLLAEGGLPRKAGGGTSPGRSQTDRTYLTEEELRRLMALRVTAGSDEDVARDIFFVECRTGLRISDLLQLRWKSCHGSTLRLQMQKTQHPVEVPMTPGVQRVLDRYRTLFATPEDYVFPLMDTPGGPGGDVFAQARKLVAATARVNQLIGRLAARAGLEKHVSTHVGRHTFATMLLNKGASIYEIKELLGHRDVRVTQVYAHLADARKRELIRRLE